LLSFGLFASFSLVLFATAQLVALDPRHGHYRMHLGIGLLEAHDLPRQSQAHQ
jgi:hypothetical protein